MSVKETIELAIFAAGAVFVVGRVKKIVKITIGQYRTSDAIKFLDKPEIKNPLVHKKMREMGIPIPELEEPKGWFQRLRSRSIYPNSLPK